MECVPVEKENSNGKQNFLWAIERLAGQLVLYIIPK